MKPSEVKKGVTYLCSDCTYRRIVFFWSNVFTSDKKKGVDVAYAKWTRDEKGRIIRSTWISGNCTLKHFARIAVCKAPPCRSKKQCKNKKKRAS